MDQLFNKQTNTLTTTTIIIKKNREILNNLKHILNKKKEH